VSVHHTESGTGMETDTMGRVTVRARFEVEVPDDHPVVIGRLPLQFLGFVIDPSGKRLIGNPAHGGEQIIEMYQMSFVGGIG
jgi:hypothetical protein